MSLITLFLLVEHCLTIRRKRLLPESAGIKILDTVRRSGSNGLEAEFGNSNDFVSRAVREAIDKAKGDRFRMRSALAESLQDQTMRLFRRIEWLSLIGSVSPMVGLFGTVFGMIKLFNAIVIAGGQPQPSRLAGGISLALVTTFWGLFIAIPAFAIHGIFQNRIENLVSEAIEDAENIMPKIKKCL